jgi:hypothetical protein
MKLSTVVYSALLSLVVLSTTGVSATETPSRVLKGSKKKGKKGKKGNKKNGVKSVKFNFFPPLDPEQYDTRDPVAGVSATSGDVSTYFEAMTDPDDGSNVGTIYGICTILQPGVTFYCNFTPVYDNNKGTSGSFTYGGVGFFTPTGGSYATYNILGAQGDFQPKGTVSMVYEYGPGALSLEATFE